MRILLISPNQEKFPPVFPLGISYLASFLKDHGHKVQILDFFDENNAFDTLEKTMSDFYPDFIGFSLRNIDNLVFKVQKEYYSQYKIIIDFIKDISSAPLVLGGAGFSILPDEFLKYYDVKYGIIGEGEIPFLKFIEKYSRNEDIMSINGLIINDNGQIYLKEQRYDFHFLHNIQNYMVTVKELLDTYSSDGKRMISIQSKRGCNQGCIYCTTSYLEGKCLRLRSPKLVGDELEHLYKELNVEVIRFVDGVFNYPLEHSMGICQEIIQRNIKIDWHALFVPLLKCLPLELLVNLQTSGCKIVDFGGTDTASHLMLKNMNKSFTQEDIIKTTQRCKDAGLKVAHTLLLGGPGETIDTIKESLEFMTQVNPDALWVSFGIRIYPHTLMEKIAIEQGVIGPGESLLTPKYYISPNLKNVNWEEVIYPYAKAHPNWALTCLADTYAEWVSEITKYTSALVTV
ncbi:MAG: radical SAM protein [Firmicutes bacterium]|nr:radical SAM protein [Bacillota bacterium]